MSKGILITLVSSCKRELQVKFQQERELLYATGRYTITSHWNGAAAFLPISPLHYMHFTLQYESDACFASMF